MPKGIYVVTHTKCGTYMFARHPVLVSTACQDGLTNPERVGGCRVYIDITGASGAGVRPAFRVERDRPCLWGLFDQTLCMHRR
jgi:hypothetical protein